MNDRIRTAGLAAVLLAAVALSGCEPLTAQTKPPEVNPITSDKTEDTKQPANEEAVKDTVSEQPVTKPTPDPVKKPAEQLAQQPSKAVAGAPNSLTVLVNKQLGLPDDFQPANLIEDPSLPFLSGGGGEKRMMRVEVAAALKTMFAAAEKDGIYLSVASAYRSHATQTQLFNYYVQTQGEAEARRYSAVPGHSEHETGLAVDVSGRDGTCAVEDCFADTKEAKWIADNAATYGFIIRYPKGKESVTGYAYEPWHLRYLGKETATAIAAKNVTMEEFFQVK